MRLETFRGSDLQEVSLRARTALGPDVMIVHTRVLRLASGRTYEVVAVDGAELDRFRERITPAPLPPNRLAQQRGRAPRPAAARPYVVALVGPTGAGKTTTAAKLAVNPGALGDRTVGLVTLDTYRVGAVDQLAQYAELAGLPLEVVYETKDVEAALRRLGQCDAVIVDTPGRSPRAADLDRHWREVLDAAQPDETHLVVPATMRLDLAAALREQFDPTHALVTKLDEVPSETGVADLAARLDLPVRWVCDGQEVPSDLHAGPARVLASLGFSAPAMGVGAEVAE